MKLNINEKRIPEILLSIILIVVLITLILLATNQTENKTTGKVTSTITNSQNTNSYNTYYINKEKSPYYSKASSKYIKVYDSRYKDYGEKYLKYKSESRVEIVEGLFKNPIKKYFVYVKNSEYKGGYFTVKFYFKDYYGEEKTETITKYIPAKQERVFYYSDIYPDITHYKWDYEIISQTKI